MKVLGAFRGETGPDGERGHGAQRAEVKGQRPVVVSVGEGAVAVAERVFLKDKERLTLFSFLHSSKYQNESQPRTKSRLLTGRSHHHLPPALTHHAHIHTSQPEAGFYLVAPTCGPTGQTRVLAVGVSPGQVGVGWALLAPVGISVDVKPGRAGDAGGAGTLGVLRDQSAGPAGRRHSVHDVGQTDGVELHHVADVTPHLQTNTDTRGYLMFHLRFQV